ncbi:uncharacterized protein OCT59_024567 [Rhizophagus irregularis]|uniref:uncharacterized protein n=1 Tax=Rhizophagus irregularis TaxID=588596 RepID=UPI003318DC42|nr:hypothetical protein OCT59_024567 [Rhizophagus irregularis]
MDQFISKNKLKWIPYDKFENINKYSDKKGFSTIYEAKYKEIKVILKDFDYLNNSNESLNEWKIIDSDKIIRIYGFTKNPDTLNYILIMEYTNKDLMEKCWNEDPLKRPSASKILNIIKNWISFPLEKKIEDINEELKSNIMEFINASSNNYINHIVNSYSQIYYTSHLHNFTSKDLNEILFLKLKQELFKLEKIAEINNQNFQNEHQMEKNNLQIQLVQLKANI